MPLKLVYVGKCNKSRYNIKNVNTNSKCHTVRTFNQSLGHGAWIARQTYDKKIKLKKNNKSLSVRNCAKLKKMTDKNQQSDTSSNAASTTTRSVKNPLLSAAVTNLTLDDFTHNAVLMPAALPFVPPPPTVAAAPLPPSKSSVGTSFYYGSGAQGMFFALKNISLAIFAYTEGGLHAPTCCAAYHF